MQVKNLRPFAVEIPDVGVVEAGDSIEVPDDLGASLCEQVDAWAKSKAAKATSSEVDV